jgi:hypothetical protein
MAHSFLAPQGSQGTMADATRAGDVSKGSATAGDLSTGSSAVGAASDEVEFVRLVKDRVFGFKIPARGPGGHV